SRVLVREGCLQVRTGIRDRGSAGNRLVDVIEHLKVLTERAHIANGEDSGPGELLFHIRADHGCARHLEVLVDAKGSNLRSIRTSEGIRSYLPVHVGLHEDGSGVGTRG